MISKTLVLLFVIFTFILTKQKKIKTKWIDKILFVIDRNSFEPQVKYDQELLKERLTEMQYMVTQGEGQENPYMGKYASFNGKGTYNCVVCDSHLFNSEDKIIRFGWASFNKASKNVAAVNRKFPNTIDFTAARCNNCGAYLGDIYPDVFKGNRYFPFTKKWSFIAYEINSCAMNFIPAKDDTKITTIS